MERAVSAYPRSSVIRLVFTGEAGNRPCRCSWGRVGLGAPGFEPKSGRLSSEAGAGGRGGSTARVMCMCGGRFGGLKIVGCLTGSG